MIDDQTPSAGNPGDLPPSTDNPAGQPAPPPPPRRRRRLWPFFVIGFVLLLLLLVLFLPAILSTAWARSLLVNQVNAHLNGRLQVHDWSLSWTRGIEVHNLRIFQDEAQILQVERLSTGLSVVNVISGNYDLGNTTIQGLDFVLKRYADGTTNFHRLIKEPSADPIELPNVRGQVQMDFRGTIEQEGTQPVLLDRSTARFQIADINQPIQHQLALSLRVGAGPAGQLLADGTIKPFENNQFNAASLAANENISVQSFDLTSLMPILGPSAPISHLQGIANGKLTAQLAGTDEIQLAGQLINENVALTGPVFRGDTYRTAQLTIDIPPTLISRLTGRIRTGAEQANQPLMIKTDHGQLTISADSTLEAISNFLSNRKPGSAGRVQLAADVDLASIAAQLPTLLQLQQGMKPTSGRLKLDGTAAFAVDQAELRYQMDLTDLAAVNAQGQRVSAQPIHVNLEGTSLGGGGAIPELRDFILAIQSGFATVDGKGQSLAQLNLTGHVNLAAMRQELGQFVDFGPRQVAGETQFRIATNGDLTTENGMAQFDASFLVSNLQLTGWPPVPINQPRVQLSAKGNLVRGKEQFIQAIRDAAVTIQTGDPQQPTIDLAATGDILVQPLPSDPGAASVGPALRVAVPNFAISRGVVNLPAAQSDFALLLQPMREEGLSFTQGTLSLQAAGAYDGTTTTLKSLTASTADLTLQRTLQADQRVPILQQYNARIEAAGTLQRKASVLQARLSKLHWTDAREILTLEEVGDGDLLLELPQAGGFIASGKLRLAADLQTLTHILRAIGNRSVQVATEAGAGEIRSGRLAGTVQLDRAAQPQTRLAADLTVTELTIATHDQPIHEKTTTITVRATAADDLSTFTAQQLDVRNSLVRLAASDVMVRLPSDSNVPAFPLDAIQKANLAFEIPDLARAASLLPALAPPQPVDVAPQPAPRSTRVIGRTADDAMTQQVSPPLTLQSGSLQGTLRLARTDKGTVLNIEELNGRRIAVGRGNDTFGPRNVALRIAALLVTQASNAQVSLLEQIKEFHVTELTGNTGLANIALQEPVVVRNLAATPQVTGAVMLTGELRLALNLLHVLQAEPASRRYNYAGTYTLVQTLRSQENAISASGQIGIVNFTAGNPRQPLFVEKTLRLTNDITLDRKAQDVIIKAFGVDMEATQALSLAVTGAIRDYAVQRKFDNLRVVLNYDAAKLLQIIKPLLSPELRGQLADLQLAGVARGREFLVSGSYPAAAAVAATQPAAGAPRDPLQFVNIAGSLLLDRLEYQGLVAQQIELPVTLSNGVLKVAYAGRGQDQQYPPPIQLNGGKLDIGGLELSLTGPHPRISLPRPQHKVLENVTINSQLAAAYLGSMNPLFAGATEASGVLNATIQQLTDLPVDGTLLQTTGRDQGIARLAFSISDLRLRAPLLELLAQQLQIKLNPDRTLPGSIPDATVILQNGIIRSDFGLHLGEQVLGFRDSVVRLNDGRILSMNLLVPKSMIPLREIREQRLIKDQISVPVTGHLNSPQFDIIQAALRSAAIPQVPELFELLRGEGNDPQQDQETDGEKTPRRERRAKPEEPPPGTIGRPRSR